MLSVLFSPIPEKKTGLLEKEEPEGLREMEHVLMLLNKDFVLRC